MIVYKACGSVEGSPWEDFFSDDGPNVTIATEENLLECLIDCGMDWADPDYLSDGEEFIILHGTESDCAKHKVRSKGAVHAFDVTVRKLTAEVCKKALAAINGVTPDDIVIELGDVITI
jgi:hypothetical protein